MTTERSLGLVSSGDRFERVSCCLPNTLQTLLLVFFPLHLISYSYYFTIVETITNNLNSPKMLLAIIFSSIFAITECVEIFKCCPKGKTLTQDLLCNEDGPPEWEPTFYSPMEHRTLPNLQTPPNITFLDSAFPNCGSDDYLHLDNRHSSIIFDNNGWLYVNYDENELFLLPGRYCVSPKGNVICMEEELQAKRAKKEKNIHKCCRLDDEYSETKASCTTRKLSNMTPSFLSEDTYIHIGFPQCPSKSELSILGTLYEGYEPNANGTLVSSKGQLITDHCIEYIHERDDGKAHIFTCATSVHEDKTNADDIRFSMYSMGFFVSVVFLAITLISTLMLPGSYHALHWKCQTHYVVCLLIAMLLLGITQITGDFFKHTRFCILNAIAAHFFFLAAFFWQNTMCFNIWWTFRDLRPSVDRDQEAYKMKLYRFYAWGIPLLIVGTGTIMDHLFADQYPAILRPKFGELKCWFYGDAEIFAYFFGPIALLFLINLILFVAATRELTFGLWRRESVKSTAERIAISRICLKLVIVTGVTWIFDVLSWVIGGPNYLWYATDLVNAYQGVFIFLVVGCQPQVWNAVKRKWFASDSSSTPSIINDRSTKQLVETSC